MTSPPSPRRRPQRHGLIGQRHRHSSALLIESEGLGAAVTRRLQPGDEDYFVLKPKHSAFFATPLEILLDHLKTERLIVTGVAADQCVANTVADARMRDFEAVVPSDCVATQSTARKRSALRHFEEVLDVRTPRGQHISLETKRA